MYILVAGILALFAATAVNAGPVPETNSQRLARGLPPRAPKFGRTLPGHVFDRDATPTFGPFKLCEFT